MSLSVTPSGTTPIYLYTAPADMRKSLAGLKGLAASTPATPGLSVTNGGLFVLVHRRRDRMEVLHCDGDGLVCWYKQLEAERFPTPAHGADATHAAIDATALRLTLDGIDLRGSFPAVWAEAQRHIAGLYGIEKACSSSQPAEDATPEAWADWYAVRARRRADESAEVAAHLDAYVAWCRQVQAEVRLPKNARSRAATYNLNQEAELRRYAAPAPPEAPTAVGVLEIDNNACERSPRPLARPRR